MPRSASISKPTKARLPKRWYAREARTIARELLGCVLVRVLEDGTRLSGRIVETEAYLGVRDAASHAYRGRRTARNESMYARGGTAYVYFTYGMHWCFNVVVGEADDPQAVLVRALEPIEGITAMCARRFGANASKCAEGSETVRTSRIMTTLCSGPARLCQAFEIDRAFNGIDLTQDARLWIERDVAFVDRQVQTGPRVGVAYAGAWALRRLRYWVARNPHVSPARASGPPVKAGNLQKVGQKIGLPRRTRG